MEWNIPSLKDLEHYFWRCTACGTCRSAYDYGPPPFARPICPSGTEFGFEGYYSSKGKAAFARGIMDGTLDLDDPELLDAIYKCTVCAGCQNQCQVDYKPHIPEVIEAMRRKAVQGGGGPLPLQKNLVQSMKNYNNPYQGPRRVRLDWTRPFKKAKQAHQGHQQGTRAGSFLRGLHRGLQQGGHGRAPGHGPDLPEAGGGFRHPGRKRGLLRIDGHAGGRRRGIQAGGHRQPGKLPESCTRNRA